MKVKKTANQTIYDVLGNPQFTGVTVDDGSSSFLTWSEIDQVIMGENAISNTSISPNGTGWKICTDNNGILLTEEIT